MNIRDYSSELDRVLNKLKSDSDIMGCIKSDGAKIITAPGRFQYRGLKWIKCIFNDEAIDRIKKLHDPEDDILGYVSGYHIMPYSIKNHALDNLVKSNTSHEFYLQEDDFSDCDLGTGNIHICPNGEWQIVLLSSKNPDAKKKASGPYWNGNVPEKSGADKLSEKDKESINYDYYFPKIKGSEKEESLIVTDEMDDEKLLDRIKDIYKLLGIISD
jgi:hypothetical protein